MRRCHIVLMFTAAWLVFAAVTPCRFTVPAPGSPVTAPLTFDLSAFGNVTVLGRESTGTTVATCLCGNLPFACVDVLMPKDKIYGSTMLFTSSGGCWDTIAQWQLWPPVAAPIDAPDVGLQLTFHRPGDPHLECDPVVVRVRIACDAAAPVDPAAAVLSGTQTGCAWNLRVRTAHHSICQPNSTDV